MSSYILSRGIISYLPIYLFIYLSIYLFFTSLFLTLLLSASSRQPCSPAGVLALTLGGVSHAALLTNMFDAVGFFASSIFSYYAMELGEERFLFLFLLMSPFQSLYDSCAPSYSYFIPLQFFMSFFLSIYFSFLSLFLSCIPRHNIPFL